MAETTTENESIPDGICSIETLYFSKIDKAFLKKPISFDIWFFDMSKLKKSFLPAIPVTIQDSSVHTFLINVPGWDG